jgi:hypothetical protein
MEKFDPGLLDDRELDEVLFSPTCIYRKYWELGKDPRRDRTCRLFRSEYLMPSGRDGTIIPDPIQETREFALN